MDQLCSLFLKWEQLKYETIDANSSCSVSFLAWGQENAHGRGRNPGGQGNVLPTEECKSM